MRICLFLRVPFSHVCPSVNLRVFGPWLSVCVPLSPVRKGLCLSSNSTLHWTSATGYIGINSRGWRESTLFSSIRSRGIQRECSGMGDRIGRRWWLFSGKRDAAIGGVYLLSEDHSAGVGIFAANIWGLWNEDGLQQRGGHLNPWWKQMAPRAQLRATIENIFSAARAWRQESVCGSVIGGYEEEVYTLGREGWRGTLNTYVDGKIPGERMARCSKHWGRLGLFDMLGRRKGVPGWEDYPERGHNEIPLMTFKEGDKWVVPSGGHQV